MRQVMPEVSASARNTIEIPLKISVRVDVDSSGKVTKAKLAGREKSRYFARLALQAAQKWEFTPPQVDGQSRNSTWMLNFRFSRARTEVTPQQIMR